MSTTTINEIASTHLGKAGDGTVVKPYVTPDTIDSNLLVGVPRILNREQYNIDETALPFRGADTWNCYEVSALTNNGFPVSGLLRIVYNSDSKNIVESKSLKLYLNSFNMVALGETVEDVVFAIEDKVAEDLTSVLEFEPDVMFRTIPEAYNEPLTSGFIHIENFIDVTELDFSAYNENPELLEVVDTIGDNHTTMLRSSSLRSNCRVTNQPDWGDVFVYTKGPKTVSAESLLRYIVSMRKENHFHEEICECIYKRLYDLMGDSCDILVACLYTRRGGIDINPVRASNEDLLFRVAGALVEPSIVNVKTLRQ